ncbi:MAG: hypothetical protein KDA16_11355 [Phycisphaerales bacterium]|nr:hypothetical protein [Phycisphaerales bacterium]
MKYRLAWLAWGCVLVSAGCARTRSVDAIALGSPASAQSESIAFDPPENPLAHPIEPTPDAPEPGSATDRGMTVYVCPMHADVRSDRPGDCPKCGMALVAQRPPMPHDEHEGGAP